MNLVALAHFIKHHVKNVKKFIGIIPPVIGRITIHIIEDTKEDRKLVFNEVLEDMKPSLAHCLAGDPVGYKVEGFRIGTGTTPALPSDTALETEVFNKNAVTFDFPNSPNETSVLFSLSVGKNEANGNTLTEVGMTTDQLGTNKLVTRAVHDPILKTASIKLIYEYEIIFS